jgi:hypothetical protein
VLRRQLNSPKAISVLGPERSGTSLTINFLRKLGFYVESDKMRPDRFNQNGYGESKRLHKINDRILTIFSGKPDFNRPLPNGWVDDGRLVPLLEEAKELVSDMNSHGEWAWKDPRLALTFPLWEPLLPRNHSCIVCVRNPLSTLKSYVEFRSWTHPEDVATNWFLKCYFAIRNTRSQRRLLVFYERYFDRDASQVEDNGKFVGKDIVERKLVFEELRHFNYTLVDVLQSDELSSKDKLLYTLLLRSGNDATVCEMISRNDQLKR